MWSDTRGGLVALALLTGCADGGVAVERERAMISGGVLDVDDVAVVGIYDDMTGAQCTGSLVAPNLVLTAQHCVAEIVGPFDCVTGDFGPPGAPARFYVTTQPTFTFEPSDYHTVAEVRVPPEPGVCGRDVALLILTDLIDPTEAEDLVPRVDLAPEVGEVYSAVGYGATDDMGTGAGERRRRDGLSVACVGSQTTCAGTVAAEWVGEAGVCQGDSGGPAIDAMGRVIGVASRGSVGCVNPVYADLHAHGAWLRSEAERAAGAGGYQPPPWATGTMPAPDAGPVDAAPDAEGGGGGDSGGGCRVARGGAGGWGVALLLALAYTLAHGDHGFRKGWRARARHRSS